MDEGGSTAAGARSERSPVRDWTGLTIANYRIIQPLGRGGMGEVLLAEDLRLNRKVAIKVLRAEYTKDAERLRRFSQEALAASALNHPYIVTIIDIGEADVGKYIVMEYVQGRTLRELCSAGVDLEQVVEWGGQIARVLEAVHSKGIVHRDI